MFHRNASPFVLETDASAVGLGAVLEQDGCVIAYATRSLNRTEQYYSVIQKESLAIAFALKQFRHYQLSWLFKLVTDHAPLQWLSTQKMEGMLCPWQMVAVNVLEVPILYNTNQYLLVIQDYFTKWAEAIPILDQTAAQITADLVKVFSVLGVPDVLHSDQGQNFKSTILKETLQVFGIAESCTTAYRPQGDGMMERLNQSLLQLFHCMLTRNLQIGTVISLWFCMHITQLYIRQLVFLHFSLCLADNPNHPTLTIS